MAQNLKMDPAKRDYVVVNGSPVPSDDIQDAAYFALLIPEGKWLYGTPGQGSKLWTLYNAKRTGAIEQNFASYARDAIKRQLIDTGKATDVAVLNRQATPTGTLNDIGVVPNESQISNLISFDPV